MRMDFVLNLVYLLYIVALNHQLKLRNVSILRILQKGLVHLFNMVNLLLIFTKSLLELLDQLRLKLYLVLIPFHSFLPF
jgi:hypothetical protein